VARLRRLLDDPGLLPTSEGLIYLVRIRAYDALSRIGVSVPEPARRP
jgi:hypothetical protein